MGLVEDVASIQTFVDQFDGDVSVRRGSGPTVNPEDKWWDIEIDTADYSFVASRDTFESALGDIAQFIEYQVFHTRDGDGPPR